MKYRILRNVDGYYTEHKGWWPMWEMLSVPYRASYAEAYADAEADHSRRHPAKASNIITFRRTNHVRNGS